MYSLDLKTVDEFVYRKENSSVQAKLGHDELTKIRFRSTSAEDDDDYRAFQGNESRSIWWHLFS
jgi:hypothetical protein